MAEKEYIERGALISKLEEFSEECELYGEWEDCIHREVCGYDEATIPTDQCKCFKDCSGFVELPCKVENVIDKLFSHNEIVALWWNDENERCHHFLWRGMAWKIPKRYLNMPFIKIFGTVPEKISEADTINIEIDIPRVSRTGTDAEKNKGV